MTVRMVPYTEAIKRMENLIAGLPEPAPFYKAFAEAIDAARQIGSGNQASPSTSDATRRSEAQRSFSHSGDGGGHER